MSHFDPTKLPALDPADPAALDDLLSDDEKEIRGAVRQMLDQSVEPYIAEWFENGGIPNIRELTKQLGSLGVLVAAAIVMFTGWALADPIVGAAIGLFIVPRTWILLKQAVHILMEGTPPEIDISLLEGKLKDIPGVTAVHDLHVWTITSGIDAMSCHLIVADMADARKTLVAVNDTMKASFGITHATIQIEDQALHEAEGELKL